MGAYAWVYVHGCICMESHGIHKSLSQMRREKRRRQTQRLLEQAALLQVQTPRTVPEHAQAVPAHTRKLYQRTRKLYQRTRKLYQRTRKLFDTRHPVANTHKDKWLWLAAANLIRAANPTRSHPTRGHHSHTSHYTSNRKFSTLQVPDHICSTTRPDTDHSSHLSRA